MSRSTWNFCISAHFAVKCSVTPRRTQTGNAHIKRTFRNIGDVLLHLGEMIFDHEFDAFQRLAVLDVDLGNGKGKLARHIDQRADIRIVDDLDVAARILDLRGADPDLLDGAAEPVHDDDIPDLEDALENDEQPCDDVLDERLRAEPADTLTANSG